MSDMAPSGIGNGVMAMTNDGGIVLTLMKRSPDVGAVYRHNSEWKPVLDPRVFEGLAFVGVADGSEDLYDEYEAQKLLAPIGYYIPSIEGPFWPYASPEKKGTPAGDFVSDTGVTASVLLDSADDLVAAVSAAADNPDLRWYVERRIAALGLEADLPWQEG